MSEPAVPIEFTEAAARKVALLVSEEENPELKLRVYITGGGCSGFQYGFTFDEKVNEGDFVVEKQGVSMVVDPMSLQYLMGGVVEDVAQDIEQVGARAANHAQVLTMFMDIVRFHG